ncbi:P-loop NTPase [Thermogutta sp.]|uniref:nucleotide-binding protein n=1 Tax=Thermogutta sp. TaxID=1962930 RepID=UPI0032209B57
MFVAQIGQRSEFATSLQGLVFSLHGQAEKDVHLLGGPFTPDQADSLAAAFPDALVVVVGSSAEGFVPEARNILCVPQVPKITRFSPPLVCAIVGVKGGVGKSMVSALLALYLAQSGYHTTLCDSDVQAGLTHVFLDHDERRQMGEIALLTIGKGKLVFVGNMYGRMTQAPHIIGALMGSSHVIVDYGNDPNQPIPPEARIGVVMAPSRQNLEIASSFLSGRMPHAIIVNPSQRGTGRRDIEMAINELSGRYPALSQRIVQFPVVSVPVWDSGEEYRKKMASEARGAARALVSLLGLLFPSGDL